MDLESISAELLKLIFEHLIDQLIIDGPLNQLGKPLLGSYACVSRRWQILIEEYVFEEIELDNTEIDRFGEIFSCNRRQSALRWLRYSVVLPSYNNYKFGSFDHKKERAQNNITFHHGVLQLHELLKTWDQVVHGSVNAGVKFNVPRGFSIVFDTYSLVDREEDYGNDDLIAHWWIADGLVNFPKDDCEPLPATLDVHGFVYEGARNVHLYAFRQMVSAMPHLKLFDLKFREHYMSQELLRRKQWQALGQLADALAQPSHLRGLLLSCDFQEPQNHSFNPGDMREPGALIEHTSVALHNATMLPNSSVITLSLAGHFLISPQLFWPYGNIYRDVQVKDGPLSSKLERIDISCNIRSPEGTWYYTSPRDSIQRAQTPELNSLPFDDNDDVFEALGLHLDVNDEYDDGDASTSAPDEIRDNPIPIIAGMYHGNLVNSKRPHHQWRTQIDEDTFHPLLTAMVHAALHLPELKSLNFLMGTRLPDSRSVVIRCADAGEEITAEPWHEECNYASQRTFGVWVGYDLNWELPTEIRAMMKEWVGEDGVVVERRWRPRGNREEESNTDLD